jgi:hypothetical protein
MEDIDNTDLAVSQICFRPISSKDETPLVNAGITQSDKNVVLMGGPTRRGCGKREKNIFPVQQSFAVVKRANSPNEILKWNADDIQESK